MLILLPSMGARYNVPLVPSEVGYLITPARPYGPADAERLTRFCWGLDNQCFTQGENFDFDKYLSLLERAKDYPGRCLFATVPDIVGDAAATHLRWKQYAPKMRKIGVPLAYVAQDGLTKLPRVKFDCLFIGGSTEWKLGPEAAKLIAAAKRAGKWVHMGRVNTAIRMVHASKLGVDSIDGTTWAIAPSREIKWALPHLRSLNAQMRLFEEVA